MGDRHRLENTGGRYVEGGDSAAADGLSTVS